MFMRGRRSLATAVVATTVGAAGSLCFTPSAQSVTSVTAVPLSVTSVVLADLAFVTGPELPAASAARRTPSIWRRPEGRASRRSR